MFSGDVDVFVWTFAYTTGNMTKSQFGLSTPHWPFLLLWVLSITLLIPPMSTWLSCFLWGKGGTEKDKTKPINYFTIGLKKLCAFQLHIPRRFIFLRSQYHRYFLVIDSFLTYYWLNVIFHYDNELMIYSYSHITENLSVFWKVKIVQAILILMWTIMLHEFLKVILNI